MRKLDCDCDTSTCMNAPAAVRSDANWRLQRAAPFAWPGSTTASPPSTTRKTDNLKVDIRLTVVYWKPPTLASANVDVDSVLGIMDHNRR